jgi:thiol-disulfide isomerase/thioredoxin
MLRSSHSRIRKLSALALFVSAAILGAGCGGGDGDGSGSPAPDYASELKGSPPPLANLHRQADQLLGGGKPAFEQRLEKLNGFPSVVNVWASWCGPCRAEFPHFQQVGADLGREVAFMGVDSDDDSDAAVTFLESNSVPYPSYSDPDKEIATALGATLGIPATAFFDSEGRQTHIRHGPYATSAELEADVRRFAINGESG